MSQSEVQTKLSIVILTHNEEKNIEACLEGLKSLPREIFIVDSGSTDKTFLLARRYTNKIYPHPFETYAKQWNWAFQNLPLSCEWILALDADQRLTHELNQEIHDLLLSPPKEIDGFYLRRRQIFRGRWIRHGGYYPKYLLKLFRQGKASCDENELSEHHFYVEGKTRKLRHDLIENNRKEDNLSFWIAKHTHYAARQSEEEYRRRRNHLPPLRRGKLFGNPDERTLFFKKIWDGMPLFVRPFLLFGYRYFLRLGFLDGKEGFLFHFLQSFWYRLLVDIHLDELERRA